jgi:uncharacterized protein (TIRG00374 family)
LNYKNWRLWLGIGVSAVFLVFLVWTIEFEDLVRALKEANYIYLVPAVGIYFVGIYFRAARWRYILSPVRDVPAGRLYPVVVMGYAANNVLPARAGELVRAYYMAQREHFSGSAALATIGVERIYDVLTLFVITVIATLLLLGAFGDVGDDYRNTGIALAVAAGIVILVGLIIITVIATNPHTMSAVDRMIGKLPEAARPKLRNLAFNFIQGLSILNSPRQHGVVFLLSLPVWFAEISVYLTVAYSFGLQDILGSHLNLALGIVLVTATSNLSTAVPVTIGGIGLFELIAQQTLGIMGVGASVAASYALVVHLVALWLPVNLAGLAFMWRENLSLSQMATSPPEEDEADADGGADEEAIKNRGAG